jgi:AcrR family transcriptional regulator
MAEAVSGPSQRADARRNRERVLQAAFELFATEGLAVPVQQIARHAGVGGGTVSRHFPTKQALFEAVFLSRVQRMIDLAQTLSEVEDRGEAFFAYFTELVAEGTANRGLAEALAGAGFDLDAASSGTGYNVMGRLNELLARAQQSGAVRGDVDIDDVKALVTGCLAAKPSGRDRMISIARAGLRAQ